MAIFNAEELVKHYIDVVVSSIISRSCDVGGVLMVHINFEQLRS